MNQTEWLIVILAVAGAVVVLVLLYLWLTKEERLKKKYYDKAFSHGGLEHRYERWASIMLAVMLALWIVGAWYKREIIVYFVLFPFLLIASACRLLAWHHHKKEKSYHGRASKMSE